MFRSIDNSIKRSYIYPEQVLLYLVGYFFHGYVFVFNKDLRYQSR